MAAVLEVERWRPKQPDPEPLRKLVLPANIYNSDGACAEHLYFSRPGAPESRGKAWFQDREKSWFQTWDSIYSKLSEDLHACCVKSFDKCLSDAKYNRPREISEPAALEACVERFSPEHQPQVAVPGAPASSRTAVAERPSLEQQYGSCRKEISQCQLRLSEAEKEQLALGKRVQAGKALTADLGACRANAAALQTKRLDLEQALPQVGPRPGAAAFAAFPQGPGSIELGLCAAGALHAGFLLGRPGRRQGWAKFAAGSAGALLALLVFSGILALLPDSRWPERLLSLTAALLLISLTALRRFARQRVRDGELSLPEAEEAIDLDEAERALAGHREEGG